MRQHLLAPTPVSEWVSDSFRFGDCYRISELCELVSLLSFCLWWTDSLPFPPKGIAFVGMSEVVLEKIFKSIWRKKVVEVNVPRSRLVSLFTRQLVLLQSLSLQETATAWIKVKSCSTGTYLLSLYMADHDPWTTNVFSFNHSETKRLTCQWNGRCSDWKG